MSGIFCYVTERTGGREISLYFDLAIGNIACNDAQLDRQNKVEDNQTVDIGKCSLTNLSPGITGLGREGVQNRALYPSPELWYLAQFCTEKKQQLKIKIRMAKNKGFKAGRLECATGPRWWSGQTTCILPRRIGLDSQRRCSRILARWNCVGRCRCRPVFSGISRFSSHGHKRNYERLARSGDDTLDAHVSIALITPLLLGLKGGPSFTLPRKVVSYSAPTKAAPQQVSFRPPPPEQTRAGFLGDFPFAFRRSSLHPHRLSRPQSAMTRMEEPHQYSLRVILGNHGGPKWRWRKRDPNQDPPKCESEGLPPGYLAHKYDGQSTIPRRAARVEFLLVFTCFDGNHRREESEVAHDATWRDDIDEAMTMKKPWQIVKTEDGGEPRGGETMDSELQCQTLSPDFVIIGFSGLLPTMAANLNTYSPTAECVFAVDAIVPLVYLPRDFHRNRPYRRTSNILIVMRAPYRERRLFSLIRFALDRVALSAESTTAGTLRVAETSTDRRRMKTSTNETGHNPFSRQQSINNQRTLGTS
ncbi:hypothetical protein PR048_030653 [Dryococelus australis]|uniref:Uncharacterized protein n=1 Tax=Dryococelus australis TaxID=614101 RepID=A0ABQ9G9L5_9NEOP|nr:hypothetical protein PR048_030653 [Dryococelus australis]